jgi:hypothetical protein
LWLFSATIFYIAECPSPIFHGIVKALQDHLHIRSAEALFVFVRIIVIEEYGLIIVFPSAVVVVAVNGHSLDKQFSQFLNDGFPFFDFLLIVFAITSHCLPPNQ